MGARSLDRRDRNWGRELPSADRSFDFVHSSAVLKHVGNRDRHQIFLREAWRVARKGIFMTTPNRWFPVEFHTVLPLVHWLPVSVFHWLLVRLGKDFFAREENLNLLSRRELAMLARGAGIERFDITNASLFGWPTNLLLCQSNGRLEVRRDDKALTRLSGEQDQDGQGTALGEATRSGLCGLLRTLHGETSIARVRRLSVFDHQRLEIGPSESGVRELAALMVVFACFSVFLSVCQSSIFAAPRSRCPPSWP